MAVVTVDYSMKVPKEGKEIVDFATGLISHFINGGSLEGAAALLPAGMQAADGFQKVAEEVKSEFKDELTAYTVQKVWSSLEKKA